MALILKDRVQETSTTTGTGTLTLAGAVTQFQTFSSAIGNGNTTYYTIYNAGGSLWEVGIGTVGAGTLSRDTVLSSSNSGSLVSFTGTLYVFCDYPAGKAAYQDASGVINNATFNATTSVITPIVQATNSGGLSLKNSGGTTQISMGGGGGDNVSVNVSTNLNGANAQIDISPTGTGHVHMNPTGSGSVEINPTNVGTINNMTIGATTPKNGSFVDLSVTGTTSFDGSQGTAGQVLTSAGTGNTPTWSTPTTGTVTSVAASVPSVFSISGSPITSNGTLAITYSGTALPIANGGTNSTATATAGGAAYGTGTAYALTAAGTTGQVLTSNGASAPTWQTISSGLSWQSVQTANFTAVSGNGYPINTTSSAITVTLPSSPSAGNYVVLTDYAGTFATNALTINPNSSNLDGNSANGTVAINRSTTSLVYIDSTQGWITFSNVTPMQTYSVDYLIVAGGGGGASGIGAGGGAGGFLTSTTTLTPATNYSITIGAGGAGGAAGFNIGVAGNNTTGFGFTSIGGGYGANSSSITGGNGGSGGGGSAASSGSNGSGGSGTSGQGNAGGNGNVGNGSTTQSGGGGGGAGAVGSNAGPTNAGDGGAGSSSSISGSSVTYAGGGGGGIRNNINSAGTGGTGGGGNGSVGDNTPTAGSSNTGGGGGGGGYTAIPAAGGNGGSGIFIISYAGAQRGTGGTVTSSGGKTIHTFTTSGTYTA